MWTTHPLNRCLLLHTVHFASPVWRLMLEVSLEINPFRRDSGINKQILFTTDRTAALLVVAVSKMNEYDVFMENKQNVCWSSSLVALLRFGLPVVIFIHLDCSVVSFRDVCRRSHKTELDGRKNSLKNSTEMCLCRNHDPVIQHYSQLSVDLLQNFLQNYTCLLQHPAERSVGLTKLKLS